MPPAFYSGDPPLGRHPASLTARTDPPEPAAPEKVAAEDVRVLPKPEWDDSYAVLHNGSFYLRRALW